MRKILDSKAYPAHRSQKLTPLTDPAEAGLLKQSHVWARGPVPGALTHNLEEYDPAGGWYRVNFLERVTKETKARYLLWLDPITRFERHPGSVLAILRGAPLHIPLIFDLADVKTAPPECNGCPCQELARLMRAAGIRNRAIYAASANYFIIHREAIERVTDLAFDFARRADAAGWRLTVEPLLAYAMQMLCGDPEQHRSDHATLNERRSSELAPIWWTP